jgi:hypothetical protein
MGAGQAYKQQLEVERQRQQALNERLQDGRSALRRPSDDEGSSATGGTGSRGGPRSYTSAAPRAGSLASSSASAPPGSVVRASPPGGAARKGPHRGAPPTSSLSRMLAQPPPARPGRPNGRVMGRPPRAPPARTVVVDENTTQPDPSTPWGRLSFYAGVPLAPTNDSDSADGRRGRYPTPNPIALIRPERLRSHRRPASGPAPASALAPAALASPAAPAPKPSKRPASAAAASISTTTTDAVVAASTRASSSGSGRGTRSALGWLALAAPSFAASLPTVPYSVPATWLRPTHVRAARAVAAALSEG